MGINLNSMFLLPTILFPSMLIIRISLRLKEKHTLDYLWMSLEVPMNYMALPICRKAAGYTQVTLQGEMILVTQ